MKDQSLDSVDQTLIRAGQFLQEFATNENLYCLETYCKCLDIVTWLKKNTKGMFIIQHY